MAYNLINRLSHAWNAFTNKDQVEYNVESFGASSSAPPDRHRLRLGNERSIIASIYTRMAIDVAETTIQHVKVDENERFLEVIQSGLNYCLTTEANIDQSSRAFKQDIAYSLFDDGVVAIVPVDTDKDPLSNSIYDIKTLRVGRITQWYPQHVRVLLYNESTGIREEIVCPKSTTAIVQNPFYPVMNEPNSTLRRLIYKLNLLDAIDEQSSSGKLDMIIKLPYTVRGETRQKQAEKRRSDLEQQLTNSKYGIGYIDVSEQVIQLNRSVENNLMSQIEYLTSMLYSQLGLTQGIFDGTASNEVISNYYSQTISPIVAAISSEIERKFLSKKVRESTGKNGEHEAIHYFKDPFSFIPVSQISDIADKFTRNEIMTSNEIRQIIGMKSSSDPNADELRNKNLSQSNADTKIQNDSKSNVDEQGSDD